MSYRVSTQVYSGPFDLLLQLVTRQKVDIGAISISEVAEQYLAEAERILRSTAANSAEWYFLMGSIAYKRGWMDDARQNFWTASSMEPNNIEYRQAVNQMNLQAQRGSYQGGDDLANLCTTLCCLNCLCNSCN